MVAKLIKALWVLVIASILSGCSNQIIIPDSATNTVKPTAVAEKDVPVAIVSLEDQIVKFECVDGREDCITDVNVESYALLDQPYHLGPVLYCSPSSIYMILYSSHKVPWERSVIHYNPKTKEIKSTKLPSELDNLHSTTVGGSLILVDDSGSNIYIMDEDLSIMNVEVGSPINKLVGANDHEVIALNEKPVEKDGEYSIEAYVIDVVSGQSTKEYLRLPVLELRGSQSTPQASRKYLIIVEGVSRDLKYLYCLYYLGDAPNEIRLGTFDVENSKEVASTQDRWLVKMTSGYAQHREFLFAYSTLIDMYTVSSLLDFDNNLELKRGKQLIPVPFGEFFLLDLVDHAVVRLSQSGQILNNYPLPEEWIDKEYRVMYYKE